MVPRDHASMLPQSFACRHVETPHAFVFHTSHFLSPEHCSRRILAPRLPEIGHSRNTFKRPRGDICTFKPSPSDTLRIRLTAIVRRSRGMLFAERASVLQRAPRGVHLHLVSSSSYVPSRMDHRFCRFFRAAQQRFVDRCSTSLPQVGLSYAKPRTSNQSKDTNILTLFLRRSSLCLENPEDPKSMLRQSQRHCQSSHNVPRQHSKSESAVLRSCRVDSTRQSGA